MVSIRWSATRPGDWFGGRPLDLMVATWPSEDGRWLLVRHDDMRLMMRSVVEKTKRHPHWWDNEKLMVCLLVVQMQRRARSCGNSPSSSLPPPPSSISTIVVSSSSPFMES
ncbi:hypothetical protein LR48_Vigan10g042200 [Vigna angularis]|uniref:Uncharacterized protein n=1 Tax=Phaseolus angularis TaxID=3914 RepID=A0A0L9VHJ3_PHAAN|nr:hypothetical protein LR48_Vigan10g042200 [Vigna angularis]